MNTEAFIEAYSESRNGTNRFHRNPFYPRFLYSDGVAECAQAGCYWLLDILGTELPTQMRRRREPTCLVTVKVKNESATILGEFCDDDPSPWRRKITYTDMPDGDWQFYVADEGETGFRCILMTEY